MGGGETRPRLAAGVGLVAVGSFLWLDPAARLAQLGALGAQSWPVAAVALASLLVLRAVPTRSARMLVVLFGALAATGLSAVPWVSVSTFLEATPLLAAVLGVLLVVRSVPRAVGSSTTVFWSRTVRLGPGTLPPRTVVSCAAGGVQVDARKAVITGGESVAVRLLIADVVLRIPSGWSVQVRSATLAGVAVRDRGTVPTDGPVLLLEVTALLGTLTVDRR